MLKKLLTWLGFPPCEHEWEYHGDIYPYGKTPETALRMAEKYVCQKCLKRKDV